MLLDNSISGKKLSKSREDISYQKADMGQELAMKKKKELQETLSEKFCILAT